MKPVVFGSDERRLFGLYHPPQKAVERQVSVLMCYPFGHEATRIHRLYRVLAERLSRQNIAVFRFDYYGAGDSGGDDTEGEMEGWTDDLVLAHEELVRRSRPAAVCWLGSRLGATLGVQASKRVSDLSRLVLWDPIVDGRTYIEELRDRQASTLDLAFYARDKSWYVPNQRRLQTAPTEAMGFGISAELGNQIEQLRGAALQLPETANTVVFADPSNTTVKKWCLEQQAATQNVRIESLVHPIVWTSDPLANSAIVPSEVTTRMTELFNEAP